MNRLRTFLTHYFPVWLTLLLAMVLSLVFMVRGIEVLLPFLLATFLLGVYLFIALGRGERIKRLVAHRTFELTETNRMLKQEILRSEKLEHLKDELVSTVSHEIRNPVTVIKSVVVNLQEGIGGPLTPAQNRMVDIAVRSISRLEAILNDLLDLSRLESGKVSLNLKALEIRKVLEDVCQNFQLVAAEKKLKVEMMPVGEVPPVFADENRVVQVLNNLVNNALRYAKSTVRLGAALSAKPDPEGRQYVEITVQDDGPGIAPAKLEKLFEKFSQIDEVQVERTGYKGTGLGLAICREIVSLHEGRIWAESVPGFGSRFIFVLPVYAQK